jgi:SAM-dependent methyltransferase
MHQSALENGKRFFQTYSQKKNKILDVGAQNINGSLKIYKKKEDIYIGVDMCAGKDVDIVQDKPHKLPFSNNEFDIVVCTSVFEHCEFFWLLSNEIFRVLKSDGIFYLNAPSNGPFHRYPLDCYRFYPDSSHALKNWAVHSGYKNVIILESYTSKKKRNFWNDNVSIFLKDKKYKKNYPNKITKKKKDFYNGFYNNNISKVKNYCVYTEDQTFKGILYTVLVRIAKYAYDIILKKIIKTKYL